MKLPKTQYTRSCDFSDLVDVAHRDGGEEDFGERRGRGVDGGHDGRLAELLARLVHEHRRHQDRRRHDLKAGTLIQGSEMERNFSYGAIH